MKFIIKDNFFKERKGKIYFSDEITIYETFDEKDEVFQTLDFEDGNIIKRLGLYVKRLKKLSLKVVIDRMYFKKIEIAAEEDEVSEENTEKYIEYSVKEFLGINSIDEYFIKFFKENSEKYIVFIFERDFIEELIEFFLENRLKIEKIIIEDEKEYILNDYDILLKGKNSLGADKKYAVLIFILLFLFLSIRIYNLKIEKEVESLNKKILLKEEEVNKIKTEHDALEKEIIFLKEKMKESLQEKEYISEKIFRIFESMPENMTVENIYFEKNILNIRGISDEEKTIFNFLEFLEKDKKIENVKYDYIIKKENFYEFFLELKVY